MYWQTTNKVKLDQVRLDKNEESDQSASKQSLNLFSDFNKK